MCNPNFIESIRIVPDKEKEMLLNIQCEIEKKTVLKQKISWN